MPCIVFHVPFSQDSSMGFLLPIVGACRLQSVAVLCLGAMIGCHVTVSYPAKLGKHVRVSWGAMAGVPNGHTFLDQWMLYADVFLRPPKPEVIEPFPQIAV